MRNGLRSDGYIWRVLTIGILLAISPVCFADDDQKDNTVTEDQCHGHPNWCVKIVNQAELVIPVEVFMDGDQLVAHVEKGTTAWVPIPPGSHQVNVCEYPFFGDKKCLAPDAVKNDSDYVLVVYPEQ
jgi:hypothetical protein